MFHSFLLDDRKQYAAATTSHILFLIELLKERKVLALSLSKIWKILMVVLISVNVPLHYTLCQLCWNFTDCGISAPGNGKEVVDGLNDIGKRYIYQLIYIVQLPGSKTFDSHILMNSCTQDNDVSFSKEFQKNMSKDNLKHRVIDQGKYRKISSKRK